MNLQNRQGFTLIELLIVIAIITIIAAILFPVFASARESGRQAACVSNTKQFLEAILQYTQDNDEAMPFAYNDNNMFGPGATQYNEAGAGNGDPDYVGKQVGMQVSLLPYLKTETVFQCPDDHPMSLAEAKADTAPGADSKTHMQGLFTWQVYGTSYKFTSQCYTKIDPPASTTSTAYTDTGYSSVAFCTTATSTKCDFAAQGENMAAGQGFLGAGKTFVPTNSGDYAYNAGVTALSNVTLSMFTRPSETRCVGDWQKAWADNPNPYAFHPIGTTIGYVDGHAKFLVSEGNSYYVGCDGIDWAWDYAGSCNTKNLQRQAD